MGINIHDDVNLKKKKNTAHVSDEIYLNCILRV